MNEPEKFYNVLEFSNLVRVHPNTVRKCIKDGRIQAFRMGIGGRSRFRIPHSEIARICEWDMTKIIENIVDRRLEERNGQIS
jgi:excisionase family DNA binding protein